MKLLNTLILSSLVASTAHAYDANVTDRVNSLLAAVKNVFIATNQSVAKEGSPNKNAVCVEVLNVKAETVLLLEAVAAVTEEGDSPRLKAENIVKNAVIAASFCEKNDDIPDGQKVRNLSDVFQRLDRLSTLAISL